MNQVMLVGRLTKDPELRQTSSGTSVCRFTMAVQRRGKREEGQPDADFPSCVAFDKTAEFIHKYFAKGKLIGIAGRLKTGRYEQDGRTVYTTDVLVRDAEFIGGRSEDGGGQSAGTYVNSAGSTKPIPGRAPSVPAASSMPDPDFEPIPDSELPF